MTLELSDAQLDALADRIAARLAERPRSTGLVDAQTLANHLGVSRDFVYRHRVELGGRHIGTGAKPPLRFDLESATRAFNPPAEECHPAPPRSRRAKSEIRLLPVRGDHE